MIEKNQSPFFPGRPVQPEFFTGRKEEIKRISRTIKEVGLGGQKMIFLTGEYGIGKSSFAKFAKLIAEQNQLLGIHIMVSGAETIDDISERTLRAVIELASYQSNIKDKIIKTFTKYIDSISIPNLISLKLREIKEKAPEISLGYLSFLRQVLDEVKSKDIKGIFLVIDDLNGITKNPKFAYFIKELVDGNALSNNPIPLLLMLCGTNERRLEMIQNFQPIDRIFEILDLKSIEKDEMGEFFKKSFENANYKIAEDALGILCNSSDGFPKLMNLIGDATYWMDKDGFIDKDDAITGIMEAADQLGKQSIDEQILKAMKSEDYHKILSKLVKMQLSNLSFKKADLQKLLSSAEEKKLNNFLTKMKSFDVLKPGDKNGEYVFTSQMIQLYIFMNSLRKEKVSKS